MKIKVKAWDVFKKEWIHDPIIDGKTGMMMGFSLLDGSFQRYFSKDEMKLVFSTGLKDKNGKEIYEGDILKRTVTVFVYGSSTPPKDVDECLVVDYKEEYAGFFVGETPLHCVVGAKYDNVTRMKCTDVEVIGNIYEHPHLLEGDSDV